MRKRSLPFLFVGILALLLTACGGDTGPITANNVTPTPTVALDANGSPIIYPNTAPEKIVSLLPSTSEILAGIGLETKIVGVDYYTNYPASLQSKTKVSNASAKYNVEQIVSLKPDLVLTYAGETKETNSQLKSLNINVVDLPLTDFQHSLDLILIVGKLTRAPDPAVRLHDQLSQKVQHFQDVVKGTPSPKAEIELDYSSPGKPYVFGAGSFGDDMLIIANGENVFHSNSANKGFPQVTDEAIIANNPEYIFLTSYGENAETIARRPNWSGIAAVKNQHVYPVNPDLFSRPGPRLVEGLECLTRLLHQDKFTDALPAYCAPAA